MLAHAPLSQDAIVAVFEQSEDCVKLVDPDGRLLWMNRNGMCAMEIDEFGLVEGGEWCGFWPEAHAAEVRASYAARPPRPSRFTAFCPTAKGTPKWWEVSVTPVNDPSGAHAGFVAISRDITEREAASRTREVLLAEMRHRQKNTLTLAASLLRLHGRAHPDAAPFVAEMVGRLSALGRAQSVVARAEEAEAPLLSDLIPTLVEPLRTPGCALDLFVDEGLVLPARQVDVVGVILGELAVNAGKHGAFAEGGRVAVSAQDVGGAIEIAWSETARRAVSATSRAGGQGLDLMGRIAAMNGASFHVEWRADGLRARLVLSPV
ncbi:PAS domain-containing protein [Jannaschia sp. Os4]|uniref:PAS domain-containing protein n=1 Tax=Jannaschia sp. Os4 TaxID=2807617 RepID=UPI001939CB10|nr:PAS domain-containing protein [Jannaschia sp. Os4]MBM2577526.1 PAS domain-containing protein [Jannaschia sp. Os4]